MNDVGGSEGGTGLRAAKSCRNSDSNNFEYDDGEWDVGIGNLIIDLDADIEKNNDSTLPTSPPQMHIPSSKTNPNKVELPTTSSSDTKKNTTMELSNLTDKGLKMKIKRSKPGTKSVDAKHEIVKSDVLLGALPKNSPNNETNKTLGATPTTSKETKELQIGKKERETELSKNKISTKRAGESSKKTEAPPGGSSPFSGNKKEPPSSGESKKNSSFSTLSSTGSPTKGTVSLSSSNINIGASSAFVKTSASSKPQAANGSTKTDGISTSPQIPRSTLPLSFSANSHSATTGSSPVKGADKTQLSPHSSLSQSVIDKNSQLGKKPKAFPNDKDETVDGKLTGASSFKSLSSLTDGENNSTTVLPMSRKGQQMKPSKDIASIANRLSVSQSTALASTTTTQDVCVGTTVGTVTEPDCLGPCEPGTSVTLEGIVWHETESGVLVVNVTWRGKTYVGTLLDCTKNDWASPRFCDSPTSDLEMRTPKNRGKRGRVQASTPVPAEPGPSEPPKVVSNSKLRNGAKGRRGSSTNAPFVAPVSPLKPDQWPKRKTRGSETEGVEENTTVKSKNAKKIKLGKDPMRQTNSPGPSNERSISPFSPNLIECPEPNCSKKYKHINGLKYHQSHAHSNNFTPEDSDSNISTASASNANLASSETPISLNEDTNTESALDFDLIEASETEPPAPPPLKPSITVENSKLETMETEELPLAITKELPDVLDEIKVEAEDKIESPSTAFVVDPSHSSRTPILTVPTLPFMSLQNRASSIIPPRTGITWQPHIGNSGSNQPLGQNLVQNPFNLSTPKESDSGKKAKHKKKSKDKSEREKGSEFESKPHKFYESTNEKNLGNNVPTFMPSTQNIYGGRDGDGLAKTRGSVENDPQSPAYSDISDANDSDSELNISTTESLKGVPTLGIEIKTEPPSSFYSPYYSSSAPPNESQFPNSGVSLVKNDKTSNKSPSQQEPSSEKDKNPDFESNKSPKSEFNMSSKYISPHQQHYYPYPYSNYHYEQPFGLLPENVYSHDKEVDKSGPHPINSRGIERDLKEDGSNSKEIPKNPGNFSLQDKGLPKDLHSSPSSSEEKQRTFQSPYFKNKYNNEYKEPKRPSSVSYKQSKESKRSSEKESEVKDRTGGAEELTKSKSSSDKDKTEGSKPTMETTGPPPPPTPGSYSFYPPGYLQGGPFGLPFDPNHHLYRQVMVPSPYPTAPFIHQRYGQNPVSTPLPEDLSRSNTSGSSKGLDLLQHAAQYYASHKIHELQERAMKSPSPKIPPSSTSISGGSGGATNLSNTSSSASPGRGIPPPPTGINLERNKQGTDLSKEGSSTNKSTPILNQGVTNTESSRSPPIHHVHTHMHSHTHIGYPIIPTVPPQYSPHYGVLPTPTAQPPPPSTSIPPFNPHMPT